MAHFPADAPKRKVLRALESLGFSIVREQVGSFRGSFYIIITKRPCFFEAPKGLNVNSRRFQPTEIDP